MWKMTVPFIILFLFISFIPSRVLAAPDQYPGDGSIYGGVVSQIQPNVLILLDTTGSMEDEINASPPYDPSVTYAGAGWDTNSVYRDNGDLSIDNVSTVTTSCNGNNPYEMLTSTGQYSGRRLNSDGTCRSSGTRTYLLGNYLNWQDGPSTIYKSKIAIAKEVIANLLNSTVGVNFGVMRFDATHNPKFFSSTVSGQTFQSTIQNMEEIFTGTTTKKAAMIQTVDALSTGGFTNIGEAMFEAYRYFSGGAPAFGGTIGATGTPLRYTSPITASCQKNYLIVLTDGESNSDNSNLLETICTNGDCDGDGKEPDNLNHSADDIAKYLYDTDMNTTFDLKQNVTTFTIGFGDVGSNATAVELMNRTADSSHGHGRAFLAADQAELSTSLTQIIGNILEINTSFVSPVVPVSPENKTAAASRLFLGLFKPQQSTCWSGNLKKYGLDSKKYLVDSSSPPLYATYVDMINNTTKVKSSDGFDDRTGNSLVLGLTDGAFIPGTKSYWSTSTDAGQVEQGGVGQNLRTRATARNIYTYMGSSNNLYDTSNSFASSNTAITASSLAVASSAARDSLITYMHGYDSYCGNETPASPCSSAKRDWILGDIFHAKPVVLNYNKYAFSTTNEADCSINKSIIYVGTNDGMLHAFKDCDGSELWAFIPPDLLPNLQYINSSNHTSFVDSTVSTYIYDKPDANGLTNGNIVAAEQDKAIILFGQRRGGGSSTQPSSGNYYALDVTDSSSPKLLGRISRSTTGFSELAETWSEPKIAKVKVSSGFKIAAIFGAGYDNLNEDARYGAISTFPGTGAAASSNTGVGTINSTGTADPLNPRGRGIYVMEVASLTNGVPSFTNFGSILWSYTNANNSAMTSSFPAELSVLDTEGAGYINRIYGVDTAANLWRFDIGARRSGDTVVTTNTASWRGKKIFASNPGSAGTADTGRKAFFKPAVTLEIGYDMVLFGTGDREHPQNKNVTDRIYGVKVRDADYSTTTVQTETTGPNSLGLYDVTLNLLQNTSIANTGTAANPTVGSEAYILKQLKDLNGWYIKLNETGSEGEKILSSPLVFNKELFITSYVPQTLPNPDPCQPSNLGYSNTYVVSHLTGAAVHDFDTTNDVTASANTPAAIAAAQNTITNNGVNRAALGSTITGGGGATVVNLKRSDRKLSSTGGGGIASSPVFDGDAIVINQGDKIVKFDITKGGLVKPLYWRQK